MLNDIITLGFLVLLQVVLGLDNLLYISLESKRAQEHQRKMVRRVGIFIAIGLRIALLFALMQLVKYVQNPFFETHGAWVDATVNVHALIVLIGGAFILYTATKEIWHMIGDQGHQTKESAPRDAKSAIMWIVIMNIVFSFDSILSAMALTKTFWVMAVAIVAGGLLMIVLADTVSRFLERNRMYEVLGLFVLLIVGVMLVSEGGHLAHLSLFGHEVTAMSKATFYFVISVLIIVDVVQGRYQKKLLAAQADD